MRDPSLGQRIGGPVESNIPKQPCAIEVALGVRKADGSITSVVRSQGSKEEELVFVLSQKGEEAKLLDPPPYDPRLGQRSDFDIQARERRISEKMTCLIQSSLA